MPTLSHGVIEAEVVYPVVLLAFGRGITLLSTMMGCIQSEHRALTKTFCNVEVLGMPMIMRSLTSMVILRSECLIPELNFRAPIWWHGMSYIVLL